MSFDKENILIDNLNCTYYTVGEGSPILFLHGGGADALTFEKQIKTLSEYGKVYAPDIPTCGETPTPPTIWNFTNYAKFFLQFINELDLKDLTVVGNSWGGGIAVHLALNNPNISKLILGNSSGVKVESSTPVFMFNFLVRKAINDILMLGSLSDYKSVKNGAKRTFQNHKGQYIKGLKIIERCLRQETPNLSSISARTLILASDNDELFPKSHSQTLKDNIPNSTLKHFKGNHSWMTYKPEEFAEAIKDFFED